MTHPDAPRHRATGARPAVVAQLALALLLLAATAVMPRHALAQKSAYSGTYAKGLQSGNQGSGAAERAEIARTLTARIAMLRQSGEDPDTIALRVAQYEFYLAALEAIGREEQIKNAAQRQGERAQLQLVQVADETNNWSTAIKRAARISPTK